MYELSNVQFSDTFKQYYPQSKPFFFSENAVMKPMCQFYSEVEHLFNYLAQ